MKDIKKKVNVNDLRVEKGGDPEIYRLALSIHHDDSDGGSTPSSASLIDDVLSLDSRRRSTLTALEGLRSKLSNLQKTVIAPKKKAGEDVSQEVAQLKDWKAQIGGLSKDLKDLEGEKDECLKKINGILENIDLEELKAKMSANA